jgi:hypothetical protein
MPRGFSAFIRLGLSMSRRGGRRKFQVGLARWDAMCRCSKVAKTANQRHPEPMVDNLAVAELWSAAGVIAGFQIASFSWRIGREVGMAKQGERVWFPYADLLNLCSLMVTLLGVYVAGALGALSFEQSVQAFGWSVLLLTCWPFALLGHYDLLGPRPRTHQRPYLTAQELTVIVIAFALSVAYWGWILDLD